MSGYGSYSSDDSSSDHIGLPKTPGAPLNANHSDSEEDDNSNQDDNSDVASNSEQSEDEEKRSEPNEDSNNDDDLSDKKSMSSQEDSDSEKSSVASEDDSDQEEKDRQPDNDKNESTKKIDSSNDLSNEGIRKRLSSISDDSEVESQISKKRKNMIDTSDDESHDGEESHDGPKPEDLFGELSDEDEDQQLNHDQDNEVNGNKKSNLDDEDENERENNQDQLAMDSNMNEIFGDDDEQEAPIPETRIEVKIPRITADLGENIHFVKLPNFLSIDTHPYDPQWYEDEIDEDEVHDDEGRARLKLKVENTIRWRNIATEDGQTVKESNARVVQWSDGSMSLYLGDEIFDIQTLNLLPGENNHLFIRQGTGLQGQSVFKTKLTFRPFSTESFTHRKLTLSLADRSQKTQKICVLPNVGKDPEAHRSEMIKKEEVKLKASIRKENKPRRMKDRSYTRGPFNSYLEQEDEDDESISISKIKNQYKRGSNYSSTQYSDYEDESGTDDSDLDIFEKKKSVEKRKIVESDEED